MLISTGVAELLPSALVPTIPQKELRNNVAEVLRRAEAGEEFTVTVAGRPVAELGPTRGREWIDSARLADLWALPVDLGLQADLETFETDLRDPWDE
jgi:prevent-host-death family protein